MINRFDKIRYQPWPPSRNLRRLSKVKKFAMRTSHTLTLLLLLTVAAHALIEFAFPLMPY